MCVTSCVYLHENEEEEEEKDKWKIFSFVRFNSKNSNRLKDLTIRHIHQRDHRLH